MNWLKKALYYVIAKIGLQPTLDFSLDYLQSKTEKTETIYDDMGVAILRKALSSQDYKLHTLLKNIGIEGVNQSKLTENKIDDALFHAIKIAGEKGDTSLKVLIEAVIAGLKVYAESTNPEWDDKLVELLESIFVEKKLL